jgi:Protein of unknown function (DUF1566)
VGWRLPSVAELKSVQNPTVPAPFVPATVFPGVQSVTYWSASVRLGSPAVAWSVAFIGGIVGTNLDLITDTHLAWCVRGPMQESVY